MQRHKNCPASVGVTAQLDAFLAHIDLRYFIDLFSCKARYFCSNRSTGGPGTSREFVMLLNIQTHRRQLKTVCC